MPVRLRIIGQGAKKILNNDHFIEYADSVPDIRNEYKKCHALIAPMGISGGSKFKILEAMASGTPIITSKAGISGLSVNETHVGIAHGVTGYARLVASIHTHSSLWQQKIRAARALVEHDYEWKPISEKMSAIWDNLK
ncbi:hypothetical protein A2154_01585 [Candidatus Gottesmanbacteria bacterium RBG_16_43_7]|uniref:Glycosyl transferase family 1 domain-containing protein n=1 Tax=Candidatus Gottesmanbacteria bacterium RBG_16_43_7 TaxID=1798373 RepID=A0A1F5ZBW8_9BACT|nr:MAG: hypothetical protein A2154_01585 [Candidatus Gottesmanbacteria bacterium RBG_16_43_7]